MDWYDPDAIDNEDDAGTDATGGSQYQQWKQVSIFMVDAQRSMFEKSNLDFEGVYPDSTWFSVALQIVAAELKRRIISSPKDETAVILYGTREKKNASGLDHVYVLQDLRAPTAQRIRECDSLARPSDEGSGYDEEIGSHTETGRQAEDLRHGLWAAASLLQGQPLRCTKRVRIFTNCEAPRGPPASRDHIRARIAELAETGTRVWPVFMVPDDYEKALLQAPFWSDVLAAPSSKVLGSEEEDYADPNIQQALGAGSRHKEFKKRPLRSINIYFGPDFAIGVQLYAVYKAATKPSHVWVWGKDSSIVKVETANICQDTAQRMGVGDLKTRCFPKMSTEEMEGGGGSGQPTSTRLPRILMTTQEIEDLKRIVDPGIHVLGFRPVNSLADHHQLREPTFAYPSEALLQGSTAAFIAVFEEMLDRGMLAVACVVLNNKTSPKLVALLPTEYSADQDGVQIEPNGFQIIQLPFSDDLRAPEGEPILAGAPQTPVPPAAVDAATGLIESLNLDFVVGEWSNPVLQRYYQALEHRAMGEDVPEQDDSADDTLPDPAKFTQAAPSIQAFKDLVYGEGFSGDVNPAPKGGTKRRAEATQDSSQVDVRGHHALQTLNKLTIADLKAFLKSERQPVTGKKADLISRVEAHLGKPAK
mmetsp:Transcript_10790/g.32395  ORF Transcript_10790/g.32395 Transcript_10790/m.32395 type:complete len:646 (-) Transcript_10790:2779-4716(-)|eukprot:CAMPEP_0206138002 /NCGR_PEP_ID=MMETSP1473-20131121/3003_1 /ASSEMBLY_ACC=CAM_ASM_001109 /TAXON_ID=1461547 /ORGANISM="Stichococcus sp, Strain RCC1054" /LENGTH=645 /DNA_ID=CAMNT_0053531299 /DNA_START=115 /DNA_END=2052 /DNA_ORIENTATION=-